jgi:hypothetical protein
MKRPSFYQGVAFALAASLAGGALHAALPTLLPGAGSLRLIIAGVGLAYLLYLLGRSPERVGRISTVLAWGLGAIVLWLAAPPLGLYVLAHLLMLWLARSLYFHSGVLSSLADLGLSGLALCAALWALMSTGSLFFGLWSFFLVQALFVAIPESLGQRPVPAQHSPGPNDPFEHAHRAAEAALRRLSSLR